MESNVIAKWETQMKKGTLDFIILLLLKKKEQYGYELLEQIKLASGYDISEGTIYPLLNRLKDDLLIESKWVEMETGMPRKYYSITNNGQASLDKMITFWTVLSANLENLI
ncbi:PadR family transcriptional regulator [Mucilaginibacter sp. HC2]|uniref:PadR family transcriptional regulator n=1 Tax=Mucilaginibacter inviolabilis TaxID=2714892 RepID=UPI00140B0E97|nr:PadR family transcriptional regulator [Mucilaginibacter inviolabilis]NHA05067.1 PadR family transcriptional regulator [Mucilaginibacter inviolabilis]